MTFTINILRYGRWTPYIVDMALNKEFRIDHIHTILFAFWAYAPESEHTDDVEIIVKYDDEFQPLNQFEDQWQWSSSNSETLRDYI